MAQNNRRPTKQRPRQSAARPQPQVVQIGRNEPCPCDSGKKYKNCHQAEGAPFLQKLALKEDRRRIREQRIRLKADGVPWYRRLFMSPRPDASA
ncbi:MAG: hypothetical protein GY856_54115 [bacterium]|nr:hypothetical protein [bacterium]